jgi:hypothetical protein
VTRIALEPPPPPLAAPATNSTPNKSGEEP